MGDPTGVGPEVIAGVWADSAIHQFCQLVVIGDPETMLRAAKLRGLDAKVGSFSSPCGSTFDQQSFAHATPAIMPVVDPACPAPGDRQTLPGQVAFDAIKRATELARSNECDAMVTAPISKANLQAAGHDYPGHTELLAELCGVEDFAMMLYLPPGETTRCPHGLGVVHTTLHISLRRAIETLTTDAIATKCRLADGAFQLLGAESPRVAVAALNPHAGEQGLFGDEEQMLIRPAVDQVASEGFNVVGPLPVDTLMGRARDGEFDAVVAMYHDQGHIALKLLGMHAAVNVTLGLPIVRTSVAHGTAPDLAWQGKAETAGMVAAIETAVKLAKQKQSP